MDSNNFQNRQRRRRPANRKVEPAVRRSITRGTKLFSPVTRVPVAALILAFCCCVHGRAEAPAAVISATTSKSQDCAVINGLINAQFPVTQPSSHAGGIAGSTSPVTTSSSSSSPQQQLCVPSPHKVNNSTTSSNSNNNSFTDAAKNCCGVSMVDSLIQSTNILASTFNNTEQFTRFKTKMSFYEDVVLSHKGVDNLELWNATIEGLKVLRNWGVKYWDPAYLYRNQVLSSDCLKRVVQSKVCGVCAMSQVVKPCKSLCHNVVVGCIKSPLAEYIESPWKHAVNSVRTAIRLVITTRGDAKQNIQGLQELVSDLNDWREPITWWIPEYKRTITCEGLPTTNCWNGDGIGKYEHGTVNWKNSYNPEFQSSPSESGGLIQPSVIVELDRFRNELVFVWKSLEKYWPTTSPSRSSTPPHALALSSSESHSSPLNQQGHRDSELFPHEPGSGMDGEFESDDEDLEYINSSGNGHVPSDSDDEDLTRGYGSGSGDKPTSDVNVPNEQDNSPSTVNGGGGSGGDGPISLSSSGEKCFNKITMAMLILALLSVG